MADLELSWSDSRVPSAPIPTIGTVGRSHAIHSRYDPVREACRIVDALDPRCMYVVIGYGAGYVIDAMMARMANDRSFCTFMLILDPFPELRAAAVQQRHCQLPDQPASVRITDCPTLLDCQSGLSRWYVPVLHATVGIVETPGIRAAAQALRNYDPRLACERSLVNSQGDFVTQAAFGRRWLYNIAANLHLSCMRKPMPAPALQWNMDHAAIVLGAGPGLESARSIIYELVQQGARVIACDAALAWCGRNDINVDELVSIDGQSISYVHVLSANPPHRPSVGRTVVDLGAHPLWLRTFENSLVAAGGHPLCSYLMARGCCFPRIDTSGGNVGHSMVAWARQTGARTVLAFGLDFAYEAGKPYARPSFIYDSYRAISRRDRPLEQSTVELFIGQRFTTHALSGRLAYRTERLEAYRTRFAAALNAGADSVAPPGPDMPAWHIVFPDAAPAPWHGANASQIRKAVSEYRRDLAKLRESHPDPHVLWCQDNDEAVLLATILPLMAAEAAFLVKTGQSSADNRIRIFAAALRRTEAVLGRFFD